jgi:hypothetical protein
MLRARSTKARIEKALLVGVARYMNPSGNKEGFRTGRNDRSLLKQLFCGSYSYAPIPYIVMVHYRDRVISTMRRHFMIRTMVIILGVFALALPSAAFAADRNIVAELHKSPPAPCVSKAPDDRSPGYITHPEGITRQDVIQVQVWIASHMVEANSDLLSLQTGRNIDTAYTAVFYEKEPINEVGIYAYRYIHPIRSDDFRAKPDFNGGLFVINDELLVLLWHKGKSRTAGCFSAMEKALETYSEKRR